MAAGPPVRSPASREEPHVWRTRLVAGFLGIIAIVAAQQALFAAGRLGIGVCRM
jgi:nitroreductase